MKFLLFKKETVAKLIKIKEHFDLCDIWRLQILIIKIKEHFDLCDICRLKKSIAKYFTFRQKHTFGFIKRKLVCFFILNSVQEVITQLDIFAILSTNRSAVTISISKSKNCIHGHGF